MRSQPLIRLIGRVSGVRVTSKAPTTVEGAETASPERVLLKYLVQILRIFVDLVHHVICGPHILVLTCFILILNLYLKLQLFKLENSLAHNDFS